MNNNRAFIISYQQAPDGTCFEYCFKFPHSEREHIFDRLEDIKNFLRAIGHQEKE